MTTPTDLRARAKSPEVEYERCDASVGVVGIAALALVLMVAGSLLISAWFYRWHFSFASSAGPRQTSFTAGAEERTGIWRDQAALQDEVRARLHTYGWVDRVSGIVHIPIERAMDLTAAEAALAPVKKDLPR